MRYTIMPRTKKAAEAAQEIIATELNNAKVQGTQVDGVETTEAPTVNPFEEGVETVVERTRAYTVTAKSVELTQMADLKKLGVISTFVMKTQYGDRQQAFISVNGQPTAIWVNGTKEGPQVIEDALALTQQTGQVFHVNLQMRIVDNQPAGYNLFIGNYEADPRYKMNIL